MNKLQKRELRKKRHKRQQYLKHEAPLDRFERALNNLSGKRIRCPSTSETGEQCRFDNLHNGQCRNEADTYGWTINAVAVEEL
jgi:hypothetical protein